MFIEIFFLENDKRIFQISSMNHVHAESPQIHTDSTKTKIEKKNISTIENIQYEENVKKFIARNFEFYFCDSAYFLPSR